MIFRELTFAEIMRRHDFRIAWIDLTALDMRCFRLESRLRHLEIDWPGSTPEKQRRLRMERMRLRYELELLKIDLRQLERRGRFQNPSTRTVAAVIDRRVRPSLVCYNQKLSMAFWNKEEKDGGVTPEQVLGVLKRVQDPDLHKDIVSLGFIRNLKVESGNVAFDLNLTTPACPVRDQMRDEAIALIKALPGVQDVEVKMTAEVRQAPQMDKTALSGVRNIVAVGSGKGGVGKSTIAVNVAASLAAAGARVGLLDGDIYGPTTPIMLGIDTPPQSVGNRMIPKEAAGLKFMSMGLLVKSEQPLIWRGPMAHKALQQCLFDVDWGELDYLIVDLPPGTGDVHLTLAQAVPLTGAVIVSTPQDVGLRISMKTLRMFQQTRVPILGIVENMSYYICPHCNHQDQIFGQGGGKRAAEQLGIPFLGEVPLDIAIRTQSDMGAPIVLAMPEAPSSQVLRHIAERVAAQVSIRSYEAPVLEVE
jgi:ATP-binding protein involved in chromosome partitioning